jgi:uncharacterized protein (TIGR03000 family)
MKQGLARTRQMTLFNERRSIMRYITLAVMALGLTLTQTASAQRYYRGGWDRGYRPYYGSRYYGGVSIYPFFSLGWGSYGYPGYYYSYSYPQTYYSYPQGDSYSNPRSSLYYDPTITNRSSIDVTSMTANRAHIEVILSDPNAELYIQGQRMTGIGAMRTFISPDLEQGKPFQYTITVKNTSTSLKAEDTRTVEVRAGAQVVIDFTKQDTQRLPLPNTVDPLFEKPR